METLEEVVKVIEQHYGLKGECVRDGSTTTIYLMTPTHKVAMAMAVKHEDEQWQVERAAWQDPNFQRDWIAAREVVRDRLIPAENKFS